MERTKRWRRALDPRRVLVNCVGPRLAPLLVRFCGERVCVGFVRVVAKKPPSLCWRHEQRTL